MGKQDIVIELQQEALKPDILTSSLLRRAYLIARKLKLDEFKIWVNRELNGYTDVKRADEVPKYRHIHGEPKAFNPYRGWIPMMTDDAEMNEIISMRIVHDSIHNLESLVKTEGKIAFPYSSKIEMDFSRHSAMGPTEFKLFVSHNQIESILDIVKNNVLDWAITLEENGIVGNGLVFSKEEQEIAASNPTINNYINNFYGDTSNNQIQQGTDKSRQKKKR